MRVTHDLAGVAAAVVGPNIIKGKPDVDKGLSSNQIKDVKAISAKDANASFIEKGWNAPYDPSTQVRQFTTTNDVKFVRVHTSNNTVGQFMVRVDEIKGMTTTNTTIFSFTDSTNTYI